MEKLGVLSPSLPETSATTAQPCGFAQHQGRNKRRNTLPLGPQHRIVLRRADALVSSPLFTIAPCVLRS